MNERLVCIPLPTTYPGAAGTFGDAWAYFYIPFDCLIVYVTVAPNVDDADATLDINDDGSAAIAAISCADQNVPGTWVSTHFGGAETPVRVAAGSKMSLDLNTVEAATNIVGYMWVLASDVYA